MPYKTQALSFFQLENSPTSSLINHRYGFLIVPCYVRLKQITKILARI